MSQERQTNCLIVIGYNGTGKTTVVKNLLAKILKSGNRVLIVAPDDREYNQVPYLDIEAHPQLLQTFKGIAKVIFLEKYTIGAIRDHFSNGTIVFEDCRAYFGSVTDQELHSLMIRRRQMMIDIILFHTKDNIKARKDVLRDYERMLQAQQTVNEKSMQNPHYYEIIEQ